MTDFRTITARVCAQHAWTLTPDLEPAVAAELARIYLVADPATLLDSARRAVDALVADGTFARERARAMVESAGAAVARLAGAETVT